MLNSIHSDLIRGHIDTIILSVLHEGDRYGYDILGEIERKSGGEYVLKQPTLYSCLKRLETQGFIYKYWGTETNGGRRTYYSLTEMGKELFQRNKDDWRYSIGVIDKLISTSDQNTVIERITVPTDNPSEEVMVTTETSSEPAEKIENLEEMLLVDQEDEVKKEPVFEEVHFNQPVPANSENVEDKSHLGAYADILAEAEKNEILFSENSFIAADYINQIKGVSYADRLSHDAIKTDTEIREDKSENLGMPFFAHDYFSDKDDDNDDSESENDLQNSISVDEDEDEEKQSPYPPQAFYKNEDFIAEESGQLSMFANNKQTQNESDRVSRDPHSEYTKYEEKNKRDSGVFKSYDNAELSDETNREIIVGREYLGVIKRLLSGDTDIETYYSKLREISATTASESVSSHEQARAIEEPQIFTEPPPLPETESNCANFDDLLMSVRSMGDEIRIRTHNRTIDKEYNSLYHYYSNKLFLFKYGALFVLMILEIVIPYFVIKFGLKITPIAGELSVLTISVVGAALLPIYAISAYLIDPYKRKRFDFEMKSSLLYRIGIMFLVLILIYAVNVVFYMDISIEAEYAFSLITPALLSTNIPISALVFNALYKSKHFSTE